MNAKRFLSAWMGVGALGFVFFFNGKAFSESTASYIQSLGAISFSKGGGAMIPPFVLNGLKDGDANPVLQYVLVSHMMDKCVKDLISPKSDSKQNPIPQRRDSYSVAKNKFNYGLCRIKRCYQQGMMLSMLPSLSNNPEAGGSEDPGTQQGSQQAAAAMAQAFQSDPSCDSGDDGFNPTLMLLMLGK